MLEGVPLTFGSQQVIVYRQPQQSAPSISGHLQPATEHIRLARHEWGTVSEMSPPFRSACPDSTRLFLKDLPRAIRRVAPLYISPTKPPPARTCPFIARNPGQAIQSRASHSIQGDPFVVQLVRRRGLRAGLTLGLVNRAGVAAALAEAAGVLVVGHLRSKAAAQDKID